MVTKVEHNEQVDWKFSLVKVSVDHGEREVVSCAMAWLVKGFENRGI